MNLLLIKILNSSKLRDNEAYYHYLFFPGIFTNDKHP